MPTINLDLQDATELAEMLKKEVQILTRAMAQPARPSALKVIKAG